MNETYIIGSGASLNSLSDEEVECINKADLVISFNKYLIFYDKIGIVPHVHIQFDAADKPSYYVFLKTLEKILNDPNLKNINLGINANLIKKASRYLPENNVFSVSDNVKQWKNPNFTEQIWASSLAEKMFHFRGSLTSVINFANVVRPKNVIKLAGVDMGSNEYFFQSDYETDLCFHDWTYELMKDTGVHSNICDDEKMGGVSQEVCIDFIRRQIRKTGGDLVTVNQMSYYARKNILDVADICTNTSNSNYFSLPGFLINDNSNRNNKNKYYMRHYILNFILKLELLFYSFSIKMQLKRV